MCKPIFLFFSCGAYTRFRVMTSSYAALRRHALDIPHSVGLIWMSDRNVAEPSSLPHTTLVRDRHPCHRRDFNPQSQQASGCRPRP